MTTITKFKTKQMNINFAAVKAVKAVKNIGHELANIGKKLAILIAKKNIKAANRRIYQIDEALVWEIQQGMSKKRFIQANKQITEIKKTLYRRIAYWERWLK